MEIGKIAGMSKWQIKIAANLTYIFGMGDGPGGWKSGRSREVIMQPVYETDKHVPQPQEIVIPVEKRADADGDGIPDFSDDCPETPSEAYGRSLWNGRFERLPGRC